MDLNQWMTRVSLSGYIAILAIPILLSITLAMIYGRKQEH